MHKKLKLDGHVAHRLYNPDGCYTMYVYTVDPTRGLVRVWLNSCVRDWTNERESSYMPILDVKIVPRMLGRHGYLQDVIRAVKDEIFNSTTKEEKKMDTTNIRHFVLIAKITSDNDQVMHDGEYIQVVQQGDRLMLLFDSADITQTEAVDLTKYLSGVLSIKDVGLSVNPDFMNYSISFSDNSGLGVDPIQNLCSILADGARYKHTYPLRSIYKAAGSISSISFSIQENGDTPIFKQRWREGLNGYISINARVYNEHGIDVRPYKPLDSDILQFHVSNGRIWLIKYPSSVLETTEPIHVTWSQCSQILKTEYHDADDLIRACRAVLEHFGMYSNASDVKLCWVPTVYGI